MGLLNENGDTFTPPLLAAGQIDIHCASGYVNQTIVADAVAVQAAV